MKEIHLKNWNLIIGGVLSCFASLLHLAVIVGGPEWYRFFGAGEKMATMAENGSMVPGLITLCISAVLFIWGLYAFSGAGLIRKVPFLRVGLVFVSAVYLVRGLAIVPAYFWVSSQVDAFAVWSSLICVGYGLFYALGTIQSWRKLT